MIEIFFILILALLYGFWILHSHFSILLVFLKQQQKMYFQTKSSFFYFCSIFNKWKEMKEKVKRRGKVEWIVLLSGTIKHNTAKHNATNQCPTQFDMNSSSVC